MPRYGILFYCWLLWLPIVWSDEPTPTTYQVVMRDGTPLATDVYLPEQGEGPYPVLLERTPYDKSNLKGAANNTQRGIAVVIQDVRGRYASAGHPRPFEDDGWGEHQDGLDTVEWIRSQPWCNGKIATQGASAGGITQIQLAGTAPKGLVGQIIIVAPLSGYHGTFYQNGVFRKSLVEGWLIGAKWHPDNLAEIRSHPTYDAYWQVQNLGERISTVNWSVVLIAGWYDIFQQGSLDAFSAIQETSGPEARKNVHLLMGPWTHGVGGLKVGEFEFPENAKIPSEWPGNEAWIDHWLLGEPLESTPPPVLYYTMGELPAGNAPGNEWRSAESWPPESTPTRYYLSSEEKLTREIPNASELSFTYDPFNPVPTAGGANLLLPAGSFDQTNYLTDKEKNTRINVEHRDDVLIFTSEPLDRPMEITGRIRAILHVSSSAPDTDFTAKFTDVYPDGRSMLIVDGIQRIGFRNGLTQYEPGTPNEVHQLEVDLWSTSLILNKGHRFRLAVSSSNAPRFEPNPNTGIFDWKHVEKRPAKQTVFVGGDRASYLLLPVVSAQP